MVVVSRGSGVPGRGPGNPPGLINQLNGVNSWHATGKSFAEKAGTEEAATDATDATAGQKASFLEADPEKPKLAAAVQLDKEQDEGQAERRFGAKEATLAKKRALRADAEAKKAIPLHRVVKIYNTANVHNYMRPWNLGGVYSATGSGLLIKDDATVSDKLAGSKLASDLKEEIKKVVGNVIVTNGHVVEDGVDFYVERTFKPGTDKLRAKVIAYARDADLAFLKVIKPEDEAVLFDVGNAEVEITDEIPPLRTTVDVAGYPLGGNAVAVSQGQIARVNDFPFAFSIPGGTTNTPTSLPAAVVDAAVNPGNSGGPVFDANTGKCVGLAFASTTGAQGMNFVIPTVVMQMVLPKLYEQAYRFLESEAKCKAAVEEQTCGSRPCRLGEIPCRDVGVQVQNEHLPTVPDLPLAWKPAENVGFREFLGLATAGGKHGVLVRSIAPLQAEELASGEGGERALLKHGDVLTQIDVGPAGQQDYRPIDSRGFVEISGGGSKTEAADDSAEDAAFTQNNLRVQFEAVIAKKSCNGLPKPADEDCDTIRLKYRRSTGLSPAGQSLEEAEREITFNARVLKQNAPRFDNMDAHPSWVVVGGFVFTRFSVPLFKQFGSTPPMPAMMAGLHNFHDKDESRDVVVLLDILSAPFNFDYDVPKLSVLSKINGEPVTKLEDVVTQTQKAWQQWAGQTRGQDVDIRGFLRFEFQELGEELVKDEKAKARQREHEEAIRPFGLTGGETKLPDVVLLFEDIQADFQEVIQKHQVPFPVDADLIEAWCRPNAWGANPPQSAMLPVCHPDNQVAHENGVFHGKGSLQSTALHRTKPIWQNGRMSNVAPAKGTSAIEVDSGAQVATGLLEQKPQLKRFKVMA
jgi:S1-C subfamily serine protease